MKKLNRVGEKYTTNQGYIVEIIEYFGKVNCTIRFEDGTVLTNIDYSNLKKGKVRNPFHPSVFNIGYLGVGKYVTAVSKKHTKEYNKWQGAIQRCYDKEYHKNNPTYKTCTIDKRWHNFQVFGEWFYENYNPEFMKNWELDKDILIKGNKTYSPETCCLIPKEINYILLSSKSKRGKYPIGVTFCKDKLKFVAQITYKSITSVHLGVFNTPEEAFEAYKIAKELWIKKIANKWRGK